MLGAVYCSIAVFGVLGYWTRSRFLKTQEDNKEITSLNRELYQENATKGAFLSMISHDLRTPLGGIMGMAELAIESIQNKDEAEAIELVRYITESSKSGYALLDNLLQWSRLRADQVVLSPEGFKLRELEEELRSLFSVTLRLKKISYCSDFQEDLEVCVDQNILNTVLRNLISNAVKFSRQGGMISLTAHCDEEHAYFEVEDTGIGMSEETKNKLFSSQDVFSHFGTNHESGTGLGLVLCKKLIELHHGEIGIESELNVGTKVSVVLPMGDA